MPCPPCTVGLHDSDTTRQPEEQETARVSTPGGRTHIDMAAYVITYLDITDPQAFAAYQAAAFPTIAPYGGRPLVAGSNLEVLEGMLHPKSVVVLEFDTLDQARKWYASPEYAKTIPMRQRAADANVIIVEGLPAKRG